MYNGLLLKIRQGVPMFGDILDENVLISLKTLFEQQVILPRVWYYPQAVYPGDTRAFLSANNRSVEIRAVLGITPEEADLLVDKFKACIGRSFLKDDYRVVLLPKRLSKLLNVSLGDTVSLLGTKLRVVGIFDETVLRELKELDGYTITPVNPALASAISFSTVPLTAGQVPPPLLWDQIVVVPFRLALDMGGYVSSISIRLNETSEFDSVLHYAVLVSMAFDYDVYLGYTSVGIFSTSRVPTYSFAGWDISMLILSVIGGLNISMTMLGAVQERRREVFVMSAVGASPFSVSLTFLTETLAYAIMGSIAGYYIGFFVHKIFSDLNILPSEILFNFSSVFVLLSIAILFLFTILPTAYPAYIASVMITPSLLRKWKLPTKPKGDMWEIPIPLRIATKREAEAVLSYLSEYLKGSGAEARSHIVKDVKSRLDELKVEAEVVLAPFELGVTQHVILQAYKVSGAYEFLIQLRRLTGSRDVWITSNYRFIDALRKQFLLWRTLPDKMKQRYLS